MTDTTHARVRIARRIEWMDTDAAGIYHWTCVFRLAEAAEATLHTVLGIADRTFGVTPRMAISAEFIRPLRFNDEVEVELAVDDVGRTSLRYRLTIRGPEGEAALATINVCLVDRDSWRPVPWPDDIRRALETGGELAEPPRPSQRPARVG
jgi:acyl-CoA thioester hydrolase